MTATQLHFDPKDGDPCEQFLAWKQLPGAGHVLRLIYREFARHVPEARRCKTTIGVKMVVENVRHKIKTRRIRLANMGGELPKWKGYALNNVLTAPIARHLAEHRPDWADLIEMRESPKKGKKWALIVPGKGEGQ